MSDTGLSPSCRHREMRDIGGQATACRIEI
jgi:hypothetical protein